MDRSDPLGNSLDNQARRALHTKVTNLPSESIPFSLVEAGDPVLRNVDISLANTEYAVPLTDNAKRFLLRSRLPAKLQLSFNIGESGTTYLTIPPAAIYTETGILVLSKTMYIQSSKPTTLELLEWI
jgi:hypothetical protein